MMKPFLVLLLVSVAVTVMAADDVLQTLRPEHPRLLITGPAWKELKERRQQDAALNDFVRELERSGRTLLKGPPLTYQKEGRRLLAVSRAAVHRVALLAFDYRLTGEKVFLDRAEQEMLTAAAFKDWNPSHYLDTAEMTAGLAIGYDWLHDALPVESRKVIRQAIVEKGLRTGSDPSLPNTSWYRATMNWNQVCFGGLALGALAVAEDEPELAGRMLAQVRKYSPNGFKPYAPDGVYPEGAGYWSYGTTYGVVLVAALESALGTDFGLAQSPGFLTSAQWLNEMTGPTGELYVFSDGHPGRVSLEPALFWLAKRQQAPGLLYFQQAPFERFIAEGRAAPRSQAPDARAGRFLPLIAAWWNGLPQPPVPTLSLNWQGHGANPVAVFRTSWTDPNALFLGLKGGGAPLNHAHMDAGSFVLEVDGIRWAQDLGAQDYYSLESKGINLWSGAQDSDRWKIFRLGNLSHNTLTINGQLHRARGRADIVRFSGSVKTPLAVVDMTPVFEGQATEVRRGFKVLPGRQVLVQDELAGLKPGDEVRWAMATTAQVKLDGRRAVLTLRGKALDVELLGADQTAFAVVSAEERDDPINAPNPNTRLLVATVKAPQSGGLRFAVLLRPGGTPEAAAALTPLSTWSD